MRDGGPSAGDGVGGVKRDAQGSITDPNARLRDDLRRTFITPIGYAPLWVRILVYWWAALGVFFAGIVGG